MAQLEVPEKYAVDLNELAQRDNRPVQDVVSAAMDAYLIFRSADLTLTPVQIERLAASLAQAERGELVSEADVDAFFDDWEREAVAR